MTPSPTVLSVLGLQLDPLSEGVEESDGVPADLDGLEREVGERPERVEDRVLCGEGVQSTEENG